MNIWFGKLVGGLMGLFSGGPFGLLMGAFAGHLLDQYVTKQVQGGSSQRAHATSADVQRIFFRATFRFMGRLAKADGRVSEQEIDAANQVMNQMGLNSAQRKTAIDYFTEGKSAGFDVTEDLRQLRQAVQQRSDLAQMFIEIQLAIAYSDGHLSAPEQQLFNDMCRELGLSRAQFEWLHGRVKAARNAHQRRAHNSQQQSLNDAYAVLGVSPDINDADLKKAYRKLMSQHHPDKLIAKGLPEEMMQLAKEKTQEIQTAYDQIRKARS